MIQLNYHENEMYLHTENKTESFTPDAPLATVVEYYIDQANLLIGNLSGTITLYKMAFQDTQGTVFMASEFGPETVLKNVDFTGAPLALHQVSQMSFNNVPTIEQLGQLINDYIEQIDRGEWSDFIKPVDLGDALSTVSKTYNPNVDLNVRNSVGAYLQRAHPLYYRPKESTRILMDGAQPLGAPAGTWSSSQGDLSKLKELIKLDGVETEGYGLAYTDDSAVREPKPEEKKIIRKTVKINQGIQQGFVTTAAERIYLISHNRTELGKISLNTNYGIPQEKFINNIDEKTNSLVRGEELLKLLEKIVEFTANHTHAFPGLAPVPTAHGGSTVGELNGMLLEAPFKILNQNIRIN